MSTHSDYKRYFIILQEDEKGFEISTGKIPTGYVKIETKNGKAKLTAYVQNVRNVENSPYHILLIAPLRKTAVDLGKIILDHSGRGEFNHELEADNVLESHLELSHFMIAAVTSGASIALSGCIGREKLDWKGKYNVINKIRDAEIVVPREKKHDTILEEVEEILLPEQILLPELYPAGMPFENLLPDVVPAEEAPVEMPICDVLPECASFANQDTEAAQAEQFEPMESPYFEDPEEPQTEAFAHESEHMEPRRHPDEDEMPPLHRKIRKTLYRLQSYQPFEMDDLGDEWFHIGEDIEQLNEPMIHLMGQMMPLSYPFICEDCYYMIGRKDYIIGVAYDSHRIKTIFLAFPESIQKETQPTTWQEATDALENINPVVTDIG